MRQARVLALALAAAGVLSAGSCVNNQTTQGGGGAGGATDDQGTGGTAGD